MSRVQKKPIRRRLKEVSSKTDEPKEIKEMPETVETVPEAPQKSRIPRRPKPEIAPKEEAAKKPVKRVNRVSENKEEDAGDEPRGEPRGERRPPAGNARPAESQNGDSGRGERPVRSERPVRDEQVVRDERPVRSERPARDEQVVRSERPVRDEQSGRGEFVSRGERSGERGGERSGRSEFGGRGERGGRGEFGGRGDRGGRDDRGGRGDRDRNGGRGDRGDRGGDRRGGRKPGEKKKRPEKIVFEKTKRFVFPGEAVGTIEEYKPGFGTVNDDGTIRSTVMGVVGINSEHRMIAIIPKTKTLNTITEGDVVIVSITDVRESNARVDLVAAEKSLDEEIVNKGNAEIYVSNIKDGFAKSVADEFSVGDIVRAKVIDSSKIGLSTVDSSLGVLKAYCSKCKTSLTRDGDVLVCGNCGSRERRKLADGYGKGIAPMP